MTNFPVAAGTQCLGGSGWVSTNTGWSRAALHIGAMRDTDHRMSTDPVIAARAPAKVMLEAGKDYWFCACGRSATQPFCNGAHKGTGFAPQKFTAEKSGDAWLCQCKHSKNQPYCDGTHKTLKA
jgi:CDGSH-type Zn-finger protein